MFQRILIATDGTRLADDLVECAASALARLAQIPALFVPLPR
jgi:hypothetical protein